MLYASFNCWQLSISSWFKMAENKRQQLSGRLFVKGKSCLAHLPDGQTQVDRSANLGVFVSGRAGEFGYSPPHHQRCCLSTRVRQVQPRCHILQLLFGQVLIHQRFDSCCSCNLLRPVHQVTLGLFAALLKTPHMAVLSLDSRIFVCLVCWSKL